MDPISSPAAPADHWRDRRVFVTGATGLLGSHLVQRLVACGAQVVALVRDIVPQSLFFAAPPMQQVVQVRGELEDLNLLCRTLNEYEVQAVFHLGAQTLVGCAQRDPVATFAANIAGTWNMMEACRRQVQPVAQIVVASSDKAYGSLSGSAYDEAHPLQGRYPYDVSKSCADLIAQSYAHTYALPVCITRCGNFFGPGDLNYSRLIPGTIRDALAGRNPTLRSNGKFIRDYLYVEDGVHAYLTLAEAMARAPQLRGEAFNFSYGLRLAAIEVVQHVLQALGRSDLAPHILGEASGEIPVQCLSSHKARTTLGWQPQSGFEHGLQKTIAWYRQRLAAPVA